MAPSTTARLHTTATHAVPSTTETPEHMAPSATARLHTTATHAVPSTTETPEHNFAAVANTITPEDGRIRPKHVESYNTCNKATHLCINLDIHLPYSKACMLPTPRTNIYVFRQNNYSFGLSSKNAICIM
jgi:hypothetical protein